MLCTTFVPALISNGADVFPKLRASGEADRGFGRLQRSLLAGFPRGGPERPCCGAGPPAEGVWGGWSLPAGSKVIGDIRILSFDLLVGAPGDAVWPV